MVGTVQMRALTRIAAQTDVARLALIGDRRQLRAGGGRPARRPAAGRRYAHCEGWTR